MVDTAYYHVVHETRYDYESPVSLSRQLLHLTPRDCAWQTCLAHAIDVAPDPGLSQTGVDHLGNPVVRLAIEAAHNCLWVRARSAVEVRSRLTPQPQASPAWEEVAAALAYGAHPVHVDAARYLFESPYVRVKREFAAYARPSFVPRRPLLDAVGELMQRIHAEFTFDPKATNVATPVQKLLEDKRGVCQDFAHLMLAGLRSLGLAARYMSGYLLTRPPPGRPRLIGADASHAWISVYCPRLDGGDGDASGRWVDFDPTNNVQPDTQHVTLAWGRDFGDVSPLRGVILGGETHALDVAVTVTPCADAAQARAGMTS